MAAVLSWVLGTGWVAAVLANLISIASGLVPRRRGPGSAGSPPVSVVVPVKGVDPATAANVEALLGQDYPEFEVIFAVAEADDPAIPLIERLIARHPHVPARLTTDPMPASVNPKLDNLRRGWRWARHELTLFCDVNARFRPDELRRLAGQLDAGVGLLAAIPVATDPHGFCGELEAAFFNSGGARWLIAAQRAGQGVGVGQTMLFRRRDVERVGGIEAMAAGVCEDAALAAAFRRVGLSVRLARDPGWHPVGRHRFRDLWHRHLRWMCCRKYHAFPLFIFEPAVNPLGMTILAGLWWSLSARPGALPLAAVHLAAWYGIEAIYVRRQGWHLSRLSPAAWLGRDLLIPALWLRALFARSLLWRGRRIPLPPIRGLRRHKRAVAASRSQ